MIDKFKSKSFSKRAFVIVSVMFFIITLLYTIKLTSGYGPALIQPMVVLNLGFLLIGIIALINDEIIYFLIYSVCNLIMPILSFLLYLEYVSHFGAIDILGPDANVQLLITVLSIVIGLWGAVIAVFMMSKKKKLDKMNNVENLLGEA